MIKVAIVGCGKIADAHVKQIQRIEGCEVVGACDSEELMAKQLSERFHIKRYFTDLTQLLSEIHPDVVHITTPPQYHLEIGKQCLENGCHIYVEKPFTVDTAEAEILVKSAYRAGRKLTVGHDGQFSEVSQRMRKLVQDGYLGDRPVHLECYWCYDLSDVTFAKALLDDKQHWTRKLPGGLLHNIISHGLAKIAEFIKGDSPHIVASGFVSPFLRKMGEEKLIDELRVLIYDDDGTTAYFSFSSQMQPSLHQFRIYGSRNGLLVDEDQRLLIKLQGKRHKLYAEHFIPPVAFAKQYLANFFYNTRRFLAMDFHIDYGKNCLMKSFYRSITDDTPVPLPYREILLTSKMMDEIFKQIYRVQNNA